MTGTAHAHGPGASSAKPATPPAVAEPGRSARPQPGHRPSTRLLLTCGIVAGPAYVAATLAQAFTREGFDLRQHRFTTLTVGDLGWIHQLNMVLVGTLTMLLAVGVQRVLQGGRGAAWVPRLLALFGAAYLLGGLLTADPVAGLPPGTTPEMLHTTWHGVVQNASRGVSTLLLLATSVMVARWCVAERQRGWAWCFGAGIPVVFGGLTAAGLLIGGNPSAIAFLATPWVWVTAFALYMRSRERYASTAASNAPA